MLLVLQQNAFCLNNTTASLPGQFYVHALIYLLFISYKFVKRILAITFFLLLRNLHDMCQRFFMYSETKCQLDPTKDIEFPHSPLL